MKKGWTFVELMICFVIMGIIASVVAGNIKPTDSKRQLFFYTGTNNLNTAIASAKESLDETVDETTKIANDCLQISDVFTLKSPADCSTASQATTKVNYKFPNGTTVQGLTSDWKTLKSGSAIKYKDIVLDIDGSKGQNLISLDRVPFRIFNSETQEVMAPINCNGSNHIYCKNGYTAGGAASTVDFLNDKELLSYDLYKQDSENTATPLATAQSYIMATCGAVGGNDIYDSTVCKQYGYQLLKNCLNQSICEEYCEKDHVKDTCPTGITKVEECMAEVQRSNPNEYQCFTLLHKPGASGINMLLAPAIDAIMQ